MRDEPDPPRKFYDLKPKEFEQVNAPRPEAAPPVAGKPLPADSSQPIDVHDLIRQGAAGVPLLSGNAPSNRPNEVHGMLRDNLARANAAGLNEVKPRKPWSRRRRDYIITMLIANSVLIVGTFIMPVFGIAGLILFNLSFTWIIWFVMDDY